MLTRSVMLRARLRLCNQSKRLVQTGRRIIFTIVRLRTTSLCVSRKCCHSGVVSYQICSQRIATVTRVCKPLDSPSASSKVLSVSSSSSSASDWFELCVCKRPLLLKLRRRGRPGPEPSSPVPSVQWCKVVYKIEFDSWILKHK